MFDPGGLTKPVAARDREWQTENGKANFVVPGGLRPIRTSRPGRAIFSTLMTLRSNDQFNTTVYGYHVRFPGVTGTRDISFS